MHNFYIRTYIPLLHFNYIRVTTEDILFNLEINAGTISNSAGSYNQQHGKVVTTACQHHVMVTLHRHGSYH